MIELGDVFIAFPGGTGTLEEVSEVVSKICLDQLSQPCIFYNLNGFYDDMKAFLQRMIDVASPPWNGSMASISHLIWTKSNGSSTRTASGDRISYAPSGPQR